MNYGTSLYLDRKYTRNAGYVIYILQARNKFVEESPPRLAHVLHPSSFFCSIYLEDLIWEIITKKVITPNWHISVQPHMIYLIQVKGKININEHVKDQDGGKIKYPLYHINFHKKNRQIPCPLLSHKKWMAPYFNVCVYGPSLRFIPR